MKDDDVTELYVGKDLLTVAQLAEMLQIGYEKARIQTNEGKVPPFTYRKRIGKTWRFSRRRVLDWIENNGEELVN